MKWTALAALLAIPACAAELKPKTVEAFERYIRETEQRLADPKPFLWADESPDRAQRIKAGEIIVQPFRTKAVNPVPGGLVHDWVGSVFIPGVTLQRTLAMVQDYDRHKDVYKPEVIGSRVLSRNGNDFHIYLRLLKKKVITVVLNSEHDVKYVPLDKTRWRSISRTTKIAEVEDAGKPNESEKPAGQGEGFLWKLNSYWRFEERDGGTWVECEAISLTRDVPTGLGWIVEPIIRDLPRESLANTLRATRSALAK
ncbi:MAG: hypothetical protein ABI759_15645 [Candidatus Solibacter sp.]